MKLIVLSLFIFSATNLYAAQRATVKMIKGKATKLLPGKQKASRLKVGDKLPEDTSIVTYKRSFVKLTFNDGSTINLSQNSKLVVSKMPKQKANMVNLLTGIVKAEVKKNQKKKTKSKFIVTTRNAVLGVRGTKFQTTYNLQNKTTSLVTVEGEVAMVKVESKGEAADGSQKISEAKVPSSKQTTNLAKTTTTNKVIKVNDVDALDNLIENSQHKVNVPAGRYAGAVEKVARPTIPVKIAPEQYNALAKSMDSDKTADDVMKPSEKDPNPEGYENTATGERVPKAGGMVDFATGLYIAPTAKASLDKSTGTFVDKSIGTVVKDTGEYIPPKGVKIHPTKGFVVDQKKFAKLALEDQQELASTANELNSDVNKQIEVTKTEKIKPREDAKPSRWVKNHLFNFRIAPYTETLSVSDKFWPYEREFSSEGAGWFILGWQQVWGDSWSTRIRLGGQGYDVDTDERIFTCEDFLQSDPTLDCDPEESQDGGGLFSIGTIYKLNSDLALSVDFTSRSAFYVTQEVHLGEQGLKIVKEDIDSLDFGFVYTFKRKNKKTLSFSGNLHFGSTRFYMGPPGTDAETNVFGASTALSSHYAVSESFGVNTSIYLFHWEGENDYFAFSRDGGGLSFDLIWSI